MAHVNAMQVRQAKIHLGDARYYVVTANGFVVRGPYERRKKAERSLEDLRRGVAEEMAE